MQKLQHQQQLELSRDSLTSRSHRSGDERQSQQQAPRVEANVAEMKNLFNDLGEDRETIVSGDIHDLMTMCPEQFASDALWRVLQLLGRPSQAGAHGGARQRDCVGMDMLVSRFLGIQRRPDACPLTCTWSMPGQGYPVRIGSGTSVWIASGAAVDGQVRSAVTIELHAGGVRHPSRRSARAWRAFRDPLRHRLAGAARDPRQNAGCGRRVPGPDLAAQLADAAEAFRRGDSSGGARSQGWTGATKSRSGRGARARSRFCTRRELLTFTWKKCGRIKPRMSDRRPWAPGHVLTLAKARPAPMRLANGSRVSRRMDHRLGDRQAFRSNGRRREWSGAPRLAMHEQTTHSPSRGTALRSANDRDRTACGSNHPQQLQLLVDQGSSAAREMKTLRSSSACSFGRSPQIQARSSAWACRTATDSVWTPVRCISNIFSVGICKISNFI